MSTFNGEKYVKEQLDSLLSQTFINNIEIIVRDDGSKDDTVNILKEYEKKKNIKLLCGNNIGPAKSFLILLKENPGYDFYSYCDQDDHWDNNKIEEAIKILAREDESALYFSNAKLIDANSNSIAGKVYNNNPYIDFYTLTCVGGILGCTMVFNKKLRNKVADFNIERPFIMHDFLTAVICSGNNGKIIYDPNAYLNYRIHGDNAVGVSISLFQKLNVAFKSILYDNYNYSIAEQSKSVIDYVNDQYHNWLFLVSNYKKSFFSRLNLSFNKKLRKASFILRMSIITGHR